ncbi:MAG: HEAT repeat domain-containing protein [Pirellulaceae bacterium]
MSTRTLIAALYVVVGFSVLLIGFLAYHMYHPSQDMGGSTTALAGTRLGSFHSSSSHPDTARRMQSPGQLVRLQQRLSQLESRLQQASTTLERRTADLQNKNKECRSLQADLDESLTLVFDLLAEESQLREASLEDAEQRSFTESRPESQNELERLRKELQKAEFLEAEQAQHIEELRAELVRVEADIANVQMAAEQEVNALLETQQSLEAVAARSLIQTGKPAVPSLLRLLADERAEVRAFAAYVLGEIGTDADEATTSLLSLLSDPDETVRGQSRQALAKIAPVSNR